MWNVLICCYNMGVYPYKYGIDTIKRQRGKDLVRICFTLGDKVLRLVRNGGEVILTEVVIQSPRGNVTTF